MSDKENLMSDAFQVFMQETPQYAKAWMNAVQSLGNASALDRKTESLAYLWRSCRHCVLRAAFHSM